MVVFFGANDASLADRSSSFQHVPIPEYKTNLKAIISYIKVIHPLFHILHSLYLLVTLFCCFRKTKAKKEKNQ